eukprot:TRINITY_DN15209_c0_g1_i1.p1 TRINITY_DN15209_c0_g1~~TRINITY_DN15209_c0_g1_i1.p1  ORF type:complete len:553 (+),score=97.09 TRINITY_DN15209_c0_g1_i1:50-1708(+)
MDGRLQITVKKGGLHSNFTIDSPFGEKRRQFNSTPVQRKYLNKPSSVQRGSVSTKSILSSLAPIQSAPVALPAMFDNAPKFDLPSSRPQTSGQKTRAALDMLLPSFEQRPGTSQSAMRGTARTITSMTVGALSRPSTVDSRQQQRSVDASFTSQTAIVNRTSSLRPSTTMDSHRPSPLRLTTTTTTTASSRPQTSSSPSKAAGLDDSFGKSPLSPTAAFLQREQQQQLRATSAPLPLRVETPLYMNSPRSRKSFDADMGEDGDAGLTSSPTKPMAEPLRLAKKQADTLMSRTTLRDYQMLAEACRRASKTRMEGQAYYNMGTLYDNTTDFEQAIECYKKFLLACRRTGDVEGEAMALNHLGVDYQLLGEEFYARAISCHSRHRDIADVRGKYVAHCNLGLLFAAMGRSDRAVLNFRHALKYAMHMSNLRGESFAYEHLATAGVEQGDSQFARQCMERCLALATTLNDTQRRHVAYNHLGKLATQRGDFQEASRCFSASLEVAQTQRDATSRENVSQLEKTRCELGVAVASDQFDQYMTEIAQQMKHSVQLKV